MRPIVRIGRPSCSVRVIGRTTAPGDDEDVGAVGGSVSWAARGRRRQDGPHGRQSGATGARVVAGGARRAHRPERAHDPADRERRTTERGDRTAARRCLRGRGGRRARPRGDPGSAGEAGAPRPPAPIVDAVRDGALGFSDFEGRAGRPDYWWFLLAVLVVTGAATALSEAAGRGRLRGALAPPRGGRRATTARHRPQRLVAAVRARTVRLRRGADADGAAHRRRRRPWPGVRRPRRTPRAPTTAAATSDHASGPRRPEAERRAGSRTRPRSGAGTLR